LCVSLHNVSCFLSYFTHTQFLKKLSDNYSVFLYYEKRGEELNEGGRVE
jgi:hypothetical protein